METCLMKKTLKKHVMFDNFLKSIFADLTVTGITDNDEKVGVITMRFPLRRAKIKNWQKSWTSLIYPRSAVTLFTEILIHKYNTFSTFKEEKNASKDFIIITFTG